MPKSRYKIDTGFRSACALLAFFGIFLLEDAMKRNQALAVHALAVIGLLNVVIRESVGAGLSDRKISGFIATSNWGLHDLCRAADIPCGFEALGTPDSVRGKGRGPATIADLLDEAVKGPMSQYAWREKAGVVEMFPKEVVTGAHPNPLDQRVQAIDFDNVFMSAAAINICSRFRVVDKEVPGVVVTKKISIHLRGATIREALDEMVRQDGRSMWTIYRSGNKRVLLLESWRPNLGR